MVIKPYLIVPKLIPQPTWGGTYIANFKGLDESTFGKMLIGQSYELATDSQLSTAQRSNQLSLEICNASDGSTQEIVGDRNSMFTLQSMIDQDPVAVLGKRVAEKHRNQMQVLIKFTQAKGNSFQVHAQPGKPVGKWKPKPESWYFFEKGKVTLGLKAPINTQGYKQACEAIDIKAQELSSKIKSGALKSDVAKQELASFIAQQNPFQFVNQFVVEANTLVDLSEGGIHHSWEEGEEISQGNIVYEVQLNVMDKDCTLRSFDKGKIADDGALRPIHINDYFQALDTDEAHNDPSHYMRQVAMHSDHGLNSALLFDTLHYSSSLIEFATEYTGAHTTTDANESFHHVFVKEGEVDLEAGGTRLHLAKGASVFIPANTGKYILRTDTKAQVIKTWA